MSIMDVCYSSCPCIDLVIGHPPRSISLQLLWYISVVSHALMICVICIPGYTQKSKLSDSSIRVTVLLVYCT